MSFDVFENIFTASDPAGGRAIKVSALTGIDSAESIYTQSDPAGGRAIKVKIIAGGASTGTLQVAGGVALDGTTRNITDNSSPTAVASPLFLSTQSVTIKPNPLSLPTPPSDLVLLTLDSSALATVNSTLRINARTGLTAFIRFSHGEGSSFTNIGDFRASSANGLGFNANTNFPINFYVNDTTINAARISSIGEFSTAYRFQFYNTNLTSGSRNLLFDINPQGDGSYATINLTGTISCSMNVFAANAGFSGTITSGAITSSVNTGTSIVKGLELSPTLTSINQWSPYLVFKGIGNSGADGGHRMYSKNFGADVFELQVENYTGALLLRLNNTTLGIGVTGLAVDSGSGLTIATSTSQKLGFWNKTPVVQPTTSVTAATVVHNAGGNTIKTDDTFGGYTLAQVVGALRLIGILA